MTDVVLEEGKKYSVRKKEGAPPDSELQVRITASRTYEPRRKDYEGDNPPDGTMLGYLLYDKECTDEGYYGIDEALDLYSRNCRVVYELVDADGTVWTEYYELAD